ncbi:phosphotransferase [Candidatus Bathyarchaeota archaeon]|nr:phosphotransferase [Candidatus Bathyarchaeota archaeon]
MEKLSEVSGDDAPEFIRDRFEKWYHSLYPDREGLAVYDVKEITSGWETRLFYFVLSYTYSGSSHDDRLVARIFSGKGAEHEYDIMSFLMRMGYPVPRVYEFDEGGVLGQPFLIMEFIEGRNMEREFLSGSQEDLEEALDIMMELFTRLHDIDVSGFPSSTEVTTPVYIDRILLRHRKVTAEFGIEWMGPLIEWLEERKGSVTSMPPAVLHRDFHPMNIMLKPDGSPVVLDWGASHVGDRRNDLSWLMLLAGTFLEPSVRDAILAAYEVASGTEMEDIQFFEALSILRRLTDVTVSVEAGAETRGMRPGAVEMMREAAGHIRNVYDLLIELTGLRLPEYEEFLNSL